jgi:uncharacterized membrane protein YfcA
VTKILVGGILMMKILLLCAAGFIAAFVDSIAGGGGLISLPAFLAAGVQPYFALGTNKFSATAASFTSSIKYALSGKANWKLLRILIPFTLVGSILGVNTVLLIDQKYLYTMVLILVLCVGVYSLFSKTMGMDDRFKGINKANTALGIFLALALGFYDGFFGPGTGSFLIFGLISIFGFDFIMAGGNARVLNFISNITALVMFGFKGRIDYLLGIPVALAMIVGAWAGTKVALNKGVKMVKPIFVTMSLAVAVKMLYNLFVQ